jgi:hypothetical protein
MTRDRSKDIETITQKIKGHTFSKSGYNSRLENIKKEHQMKSFNSVANFNLEKVNEKIN